MTLKHLRVFHTVCVENSITKAAEKLYMSQPAVSLSIKELETYYNVKLFDRMNRTLYITEKGRILFEYAENILSQFSEARDVVSGGIGESFLRIGANLTLGENFLPEILNRYNELYPNVKISVTINNSKEIEDLLASNKLDMAFIDNISDLKTLTFIPFRKEEMSVLCGKDYAPGLTEISLSDLASMDLLLREKGSGVRTVTDHLFQAYGYTVSPALESTSTTAIIRFAENGFGATILPESAVAESLAKGTLRRLELKAITFTKVHFVAYHTRKFKTEPMENMLNMLDITEE